MAVKSKVATPTGKSMSQLLDEWGTDPSAPKPAEQIPRKKKPKVNIPKTKRRLSRQKYLTTAQGYYRVDEALKQALE